LAAEQAAEAVAREAERKAREEAQARCLAEHAKREAAEREAILAARRAGRKKKKRGGRWRPSWRGKFLSDPQQHRRQRPAAGAADPESSLPDQSAINELTIRSK